MINHLQGMRCLVVIVCVVVASQLFGKKRLSESYKYFREIIDTFCHNHLLLGNSLLVLESGRMVISLAERLPAARIADLVADKIGLEIDDSVVWSCQQFPATSPTISGLRSAVVRCKSIPNAILITILLVIKINDYLLGE